MTIPNELTIYMEYLENDMTLSLTWCLFTNRPPMFNSMLQPLGCFNVVVVVGAGLFVFILYFILE